MFLQLEIGQGLGKLWYEPNFDPKLYLEKSLQIKTKYCYILTIIMVYAVVFYCGMGTFTTRVDWLVVYKLPEFRTPLTVHLCSIYNHLICLVCRVLKDEMKK